MLGFLTNVAEMECVCYVKERDGIGAIPTSNWLYITSKMIEDTGIDFCI